MSRWVVSALPVVLVIVGLIAYPFLYSIWLSLQDVKIGGQGTFVGLNNYFKLLFDSTSRIHSDFANSARVTLVEKSRETQSRKVRVWAELNNPGWLLPGARATLVVPPATAVGRR